MGLFVFLTVSAIAASQMVQTRYWKPATSQVAIPVRVFDGQKFVADLRLSDFEIFENDAAQKPVALYLMKKNEVARQEGEADVPPEPVRRFFIMIQTTDYHPKLKSAIDSFFADELRPGDSLEIQTPMKNYQLSADALATKARTKLATELNDIVKKDVAQGGMAYNSLVRDLKRLVRLISGNRGASLDDFEGDLGAGFGLETQLQQYKMALAKMDALRQLDEAKLLTFARMLKEQDGQKVIVFIYQREFQPEISGSILNDLQLANQDKPNILGDIQELFSLYHRNVTLNQDKLSQAFADAGVNFNFLYMNKQPERILGTTMAEQSEDIFKAFSGVAAATGGLVSPSENPDSGIQEVLKAADSSYILYYTPTGPKTALFKSVRVRVKGKDYRVVARAGYL